MSEVPEYQKTVLTPDVTQWQEYALRKGGEPPYDGGDGGGSDMDIRERITAIEKAQIQTGMDMSYVRGRIEDLPTKDWFNTRMIALFSGLAVFITVALAVFGAVS